MKPLNQIKVNLAGMVLGWFPFNIVSDSPRSPFKMAAVTKNKTFFTLLQIKMNSNFNCSYMQSLTITTLWDFESRWQGLFDTKLCDKVGQ